jgi:hypothetical protein
MRGRWAWHCMRYRLLAPFRFLGFAARFRVLRLTENVVVVRFGEGNPKVAQNSIRINWLETCEWGLSVFVGPRMSSDATAKMAGLRHPKIAETTIGRLRRSGFAVTSCDWTGHCVIRFGSSPDEAELEGLRKIFGTPRPNPVTGG